MSISLKKYAAIDIGSNAVRLLISDVIEHSGTIQFKKSELVRVPIRLVRMCSLKIIFPISTSNVYPIR